MKKLLILSFLFLFALGSHAQNDDLKSFLADKIAEYSANDDLEIKVIGDGSTRGSRTYANGNKAMKIKIHRIPAEMAEKAKGEFTKLIGMFKELGESGVMDIKDLNSEGMNGIASFNENRKSSGLFMHLKGKYMLEVEMMDSSSMDEALGMYKNLDFSVL